MIQIIEYVFLQGLYEKYWSMAYLIYTAVHIAFSKKKIVRRNFCFDWEEISEKSKEIINKSKGIINNLSIILFNYCLFIYRSVKDQIKCKNPFKMLTKEHLVHAFQTFLYFHVCEFSCSCWFDVIWWKYVWIKEMQKTIRGN